VKESSDKVPTLVQYEYRIGTSQRPSNVLRNQVQVITGILLLVLTFRDPGHSTAFGPSLLEFRMIQGATMPFVRNGLREVQY